MTTDPRPAEALARAACSVRHSYHYGDATPCSVCRSEARPTIAALSEAGYRIEAAGPDSPQTRTAEEALARILEGFDWPDYWHSAPVIDGGVYIGDEGDYDAKKMARRLVQNLSEAGYRIEAAGDRPDTGERRLREALNKTARAQHHLGYANTEHVKRVDSPDGEADFVIRPFEECPDALCVEARAALDFEAGYRIEAAGREAETAAVFEAARQVVFPDPRARAEALPRLRAALDAYDAAPGPSGPPDASTPILGRPSDLFEPVDDA